MWSIWQDEKWQQKERSIEQYLQRIREADEPETMKKALLSSPCFIAYIEKKFQEFEREHPELLPWHVNLLRAIAWKESHWNPWAIGDYWDGEFHSYGMFQINKDWWDYDIDEFLKPNIKLQIEKAWYIVNILLKRHKKLFTAIRAYNGDITIEQTMWYAIDVLQFYVTQPWMKYIERCFASLGIKEHVL